MPDKAKQIAESINNIIPFMNILERERLLGFGEGLAFALAGRDAVFQTDTVPEGIRATV